MLAVLLGLGTWQFNRMIWKRAVLAEIAAAELRPAIDLGDQPAPFTKIRVAGRFRHDLAALYGAEGRQAGGQPVMGAQLIVPLERPTGPPILVLRGWVPHLPPSPGEPGTTTVEAYVRPGERPGLFAAQDDFAGRRFYTLNPEAIGTALGLTRVAPFVLVALGPTPPDLIPDPVHSLPRPADNHLSYVITWYGLALALAVIFTVHARKVLRP